jgi:hypothetical protein
VLSRAGDLDAALMAVTRMMMATAIKAPITGPATCTHQPV